MKFFDRLSKAKLTVNLAKTEFCHATVTFLGHLVGQGQVKPLEAKVNAISEFPVPKCKRQLMRFLVWLATIGNSVKISQVLLNL